MTSRDTLRVLLLGNRGMLGSEIALAAPGNVTLVLPANGRVDIRDHALVAQQLRELRPDVVINAAAYTAVDRAEEDEAKALSVNGTAVGALGRACAALGIRVCHFSTDYVFAGDAGRPYGEQDTTAPLGAYGRTKLAGERLLLESGARTLLIRTQWLFGRQGRSFPRTMWDRAHRGEATRVVDDQRGCPTYAADLASAVWSLVLADDSGIVHAVNDGDASWFDVAQAVFAAAGATPLLSPCRTADYPTLARRPADSRMDPARCYARLGRPLPPWPDALRRFLDHLRAG